MVTNEYFSSLVRNGGGAVWTDAIYPLSDYLKKSKPHVVYINDWGIFNVVRLLTEGQLPLQVGSDPLNKPSFDESARRILRDRISESRAVFVTHTDQNEMFKGVNAKLQTLATEAGYRNNGPPGERPQYHPGYYAAYVLDADGNNVEVVNHHRT